MILVGNQRGGARDLALHLMKPENERVEIHQLRGFVSDDLRGAFQESEAVARGTRCRQHLFSLSLNPPVDATLSNRDFEKAIDRAEADLGLQGQPRAIVFHEKRGDDGQLRRHAHAVWRPIDAQSMTAKQLSFTHRTLQDVSRDLYIEHDWRMPEGLRQKELRDPRNFTLAEWQQAKRNGHNPRAIKRVFQESWSRSDSKAAFAHALEEHGFILAKGDRRGFVAVDHTGEAYAVARSVGAQSAKLKEKLGAPDALPNVAQAHAIAAERVSARLKELHRLERAQAARKLRAQRDAKKRLLAKQARDAAQLHHKQLQRQHKEEEQRRARIRTGVLGFLDRFTGRRNRTLKENAAEAAWLQKRDAAEQNHQHVAHRLEQEAQAQRLEAALQPHRDASHELAMDAGQRTKDAETARNARREASMRTRKPKADRPKRRSRARDGPNRER